MRIAYEFKQAPSDVLGWDAAEFDYACAYIRMLDDAEKEQAAKMRSGAGAGKSGPVMRGGRR